MSFEEALAFTLEWEGGHVDDPADPGGETKFGISKRSFPDEDIAALTIGRATQLYSERYWQPLAAGHLPRCTATALFDWAVHSGVMPAAQALQSELRGLKVDGRVGTRTRERLAQRMAAGLTDGDLAYKIVMRRVRFLTKHVARRPHSLRFLHGWMRRTHALVRLLAGYAAHKD